MAVIANNQKKLKWAIYACSLLLISLSLSCKDGDKKNKTETDQIKATGTAKDSAYVVEVTAADYVFGMPTEVPSGWVTFRMKNRGQEEHNAIIFKYSDSITYPELIKSIGKAMKEEKMMDPANIFHSQIETAMGGPAILSPGLTGETTVLLEPGVHALTCWMVAEDGEYHLMKGMTRPFVVTEEKSGAEKPEASVDITVEDVAIRIEDPIEAGEHVFNVNFETMDNVHLAKLKEGQNLEDLKLWMNKAQNPSPFTFLGGAEQAPVGMTNTFKASLAPGRYALVTYGRAIMGMAEEFMIPENGAAPKSKEPENSLIVIRNTSGGIQIPEEVQTGRTPVKLQATGDKQGLYVLGRLKEGKSMAEIKQFLNNASETTPPYHPIWWGSLSPDEEVSLNLEFQAGTYLVAGPLPSGDQMPANSKTEELIHLFKVD